MSEQAVHGQSVYAQKFHGLATRLNRETGMERDFYMHEQRSNALRSSGWATLAAMMVCGAAFNAQAADLYRGSLKDSPGSYKDSPEYLPVLPAWGGLYMGGHLGGAWSDVGGTDTYTYVQDPTIGVGVSSGGVIGGGQIGFNLQSGNFVYGAEVDLGGMSLSGDKTAELAGYPTPLVARYSFSGGFYGDFTGRLGIVANRTLFYAKGGAAFLDADFKSHYLGMHTDFDFSHSEVMWGWTVGAGVEYKLTPSWSIKAEYQHFDFGSASFSDKTSRPFPCTIGTCYSDLSSNTKISATADAVTFGINYFLNPDSGQIK
jgi:outer membrane immunogenic protein